GEDEDLFEVVFISRGLENANMIARQSDAAIVFVGNHPLINGKEDQDRPDIQLPEAQVELIKSVYASNKNTIVCLVGSYPFAINEIHQIVPSIIYSAHGSQELGSAFADVLFGDFSPSGRLNMT